MEITSEDAANRVEVVMSFNFQFVTETKERAIELTKEQSALPEVPEEVGAFIIKALEGMVLPTSKNVIEVRAEGHMPQVTGNSMQLGNLIISVRAIPIRE